MALVVQANLVAHAEFPDAYAGLLHHADLAEHVDLIQLKTCVGLLTLSVVHADSVGHSVKVALMN